MPFTVVLVYTSTGSEPDRARPVGRTIEGTTRNSDLVAYVGGGRFVILMLGTNLQDVRIAVARIDDTLEGLDPEVLSLGLVAYSADMKNSHQLLEAADDALLKCRSRWWRRRLRLNRYVSSRPA